MPRINTENERRAVFRRLDLVEGKHEELLKEVNDVKTVMHDALREMQETVAMVRRMAPPKGRRSEKNAGS